MVGVTISFLLVDSIGAPTDAFDVTTGERVSGSVSAITNAQGEFSVYLWPNGRGNKTTKYTCSSGLNIPAFSSQVPAGAGSLSWLNFKTNGIILTPAQVTVLDAHIADSNIHLSPTQLGLKADKANFDAHIADVDGHQLPAQLNLKSNKATPVFTGNLIMEKTVGIGVKLGNITANSYGWNDLIGTLVHGKGGPVPVLSPVIGGLVREYAYITGDQGGNAHHIKHDHAPNTDTFIHIHWMHNGTAISGELKVTFNVTYAKGHNQAAFHAEKVITLTIPTPDVATIPRYRHMISEIQLSSMTPTVNQLDSALLEPDGEILSQLTVTTAPTIPDSSRVNSVFIFHMDIHYQTTGLATANKAPNFYA